MLSKIILLVLICCYCSVEQTCPDVPGNDSLQSGRFFLTKNGFNSISDQTYQISVGFPIGSGVDIAITTARIQDYSPQLGTGFNYYIDGRQVGTANQVEFKIIIQNDLSWSSIELSYIVSGRTDLTLGNIQFLSQEWSPQGQDFYTVTTEITKNLPVALYNAGSFISGFLTSDPEFNIDINYAFFKQGKLQIVFYSTADPIFALTFAYVIYPKYHPIYHMVYYTPGVGPSDTYQISGPVNIQFNMVEYSQWEFVILRNLTCSGDKCTSPCISKEKCVENGGNVWRDQCLYCPPGIIFEKGTCTRKCRPNWGYVSGVCVCSIGYTRKGDDCVDGKGCGFGSQYSASIGKCICKQGYAKRQGGLCVECPAGSSVSSDGQSCMCSGIGQIFDPFLNFCWNNLCGGGQEWINNRCQCIQKHSWWHLNCRRCPDDSVHTSQHVACRCLNPNAVFDPLANSC